MPSPRKRYLLIPLVYVAVIGVFLWLQFGTGQTVTESVQGLQIRAVREAGSAASGSAVRRITLSYGAAEFRFSRLRPLLVGESRARLRPVAWSMSADGATVDFRGLGGRDLSVVFRVEGGERGALDVTAGTDEALALPLESPGARIEISESVPAIGIERGDERLVAILPQGSRVQWSGGYLYFNGAAARLRLARSTGGSLLMQWFLAQGSLVGEEAYGREINAYRDRAWLGWTQTRYLREIGLWRRGDGQPDYTGRLGSALMAEASPRGEHQRALALVVAAEDVWTRVRPTAERTRETGLFTGDVAGFAAWRAGIDSPQAREAERLLRAGNPAAFSIPELVPLLQSAGAAGVLAEAGEKSLARWNPEETDIATSLGVLEASLDSRSFPWLAAAGERALSRIFAALRIDRSALRIVQGDSADPLLALRAGTLLLRAASTRQNPTLAGIGRSLIVTVLKTADAEGFVTGPGGRVAAEDVYHEARMSPYLPSRRPLADAFGPGVGMWSAAPLRSATTAGNEVTLTFAFVPGVPHFVLLQGLASIGQLRLRGIPWRPDPAFAQYFAGWFHDAGTRSLALKLTQEQAEEQVVIVR